jgi:hypothetical protein
MQVYFTRHAQSVFNAVSEEGLKPDDSDPMSVAKPFSGMWDCGLTEKGRKQIEKCGMFITNNPIDFVLVSPYTRCLDTVMATYFPTQDDSSAKPRMYAMSLLMEYSDSPDCIGSPISQLKEKYPRVDFHTLLLKKSPNKESNWYDMPLRKNIIERISLFETFLSENEKVFKGKTLHVITHGGFLENLLHKPVENYESFLMSFDPKLKKWSPSWRALKPLYVVPKEI